jgi:peptide-methionine (S)-S-oxide reductase
MNKLVFTSFILAIVATILARPIFAADQVPSTKKDKNQKLEKAIFGMGCFWKSQFVFSKVPGVAKTTVGYCGGALENPTYEQVCTHRTGHVETVLVEYDPNKTSYQNLLAIFFKSHDPTTLNRQGPDLGNNYRSVIFYTTPEQQKEAVQYKDQLEKSHQFDSRIVTAIEPAKPFYPAEDYHQNFYVKHGAACN